MIRLRASNSSGIFSGASGGLTPVQSATLDGLLAKVKLTEIQAAKRDELIAKRDAKPELSDGAKTIIEDIVNTTAYQYKDSFGSRETDKGTRVEDDSIELYNRIFFTDYKKLVEGDEFYELVYKCLGGHPDIADKKRLKVVDIKSPWSKKTFPKLESKAQKKVKEAGYDWQIKSYLFMLRKMTGLDWRDGEVAYMLSDTPEDLLNEWDEPTLHYMGDVPDQLRATIVKVTLTDDEIAVMDAALDASIEYAKWYTDYLKTKNQ
jgi:hypothetical protein